MRREPIGRRLESGETKRAPRKFNAEMNVAAVALLDDVRIALADESVQIVDASAGPNIDVMQVGHTVSRAVLDVQPKQEGIIANVSSGLPLVLRDVSMTPREGIAGSVDFNVLSGGPVNVTVASVGPNDDPRSALSLAPLPRRSLQTGRGRSHRTANRKRSTASHSW